MKVDLVLNGAVLVWMGDILAGHQLGQSVLDHLSLAEVRGLHIAGVRQLLDGSIGVLDEDTDAIMGMAALVQGQLGELSRLVGLEPDGVLLKHVGTGVELGAEVELDTFVLKPRNLLDVDAIRIALQGDGLVCRFGDGLLDVKSKEPRDLIGLLVNIDAEIEQDTTDVFSEDSTVLWIGWILGVVVVRLNAADLVLVLVLHQELGHGLSGWVQEAMHADDEASRVNITLFEALLEVDSCIQSCVAWLLGEHDRVCEVFEDFKGVIVSIFARNTRIVEDKRLLLVVHLLHLLDGLDGDGWLSWVVLDEL